MKRLLALCLISGGAASADIAFEWPVDCVQGDSCYIQNYADADPGEGYRDFTCGALSYDTHSGTDIALPTRDMLAQNVDVLAAAPGRVRGTRDGMPDALYTGQDLEGRDCGNGVAIDHGDGWVTQYCHLRQGSVVVGSGERVDAGTKLGEIGLSGRTQFAHMHFSIRKDGEVVDPFAPDAPGTCGAAPERTLWADDVTYVPSGLLDVGFATGVPDYDAVKAGVADQPLTRDAPIVLFGFAFGGRTGDILRLAIDGPDGNVIRQDADVTRNRAQFFRASGRRAPDRGWPQGTYRGTVSLIRAGKTIQSREIQVTLR